MAVKKATMHFGHFRGKTCCLVLHYSLQGYTFISPVDSFLPTSPPYLCHNLSSSFKTRTVLALRSWSEISQAESFQLLYNLNKPAAKFPTSRDSLRGKFSSQASNKKKIYQTLQQTITIYFSACIRKMTIIQIVLHR